jgi:drug/metabolite transporter (DMT)-like permease
MGAKTKSRPQAFAAFTLLLLLCIWSTSAFALISLSDGSYGLVLSSSARSSVGTKPFVGSGGSRDFKSGDFWRGLRLQRS